VKAGARQPSITEGAVGSGGAASIDGYDSGIQTIDSTELADPWKLDDIDMSVCANDPALMESGQAYWVYVRIVSMLGFAS